MKDVQLKKGTILASLVIELMYFLIDVKEFTILIKRFIDNGTDIGDIGAHNDDTKTTLK